MCRPVVCKTCSKTTWAGCGQHVASVMGPVPKDQRCTCDRTAAKPRSLADWLPFGRR